MSNHLRTRTRHPVNTLAVCLLVAIAGVLALGSASASADTQSFRSSTAISLPGNGNASSYPSTINAPAMEGVLIGVTVTFHGFSHGSAQSVNALLVAPDGKTSLLMTGSCATDVPLTTFVFSDQGLAPMPYRAPCDKVAYKPTENTPDGWVDFGPGAPEGPYSANMNNFLGSTTYGAWKLYIKGYGGAASGKIAGGWSLTLDTRVPDAIVPGSGSVTRTVTGMDGVITDVNVLVPGIFHQNGADLEMLLLGPRGGASVLMADSCPGDVRYEGWRFDDEAASYPPVEAPCPTATYKPVGRSDQPFPGVPSGVDSPLSKLDLRDPNGSWTLQVLDDHPFDAFSGLLLQRFELQIQTRPAAALELVTPALEIDEGGSGELILRRSAGGATMGEARVVLGDTPGSAGADDYRQATVSVEFAPGETEKRVRVEALADAVSDPDETFQLKVGSVSGDAKPTGATTATVTIRDVSPDGGVAQPTGETPGSGQAGDAPADRSAPQVSGVGLAPTRFRIARRGTATVARARRGTRIRYSLSEPAAVTLRFQRAGRGGRWAGAGTLRRSAFAGASRVAFSGRIGRRALRPGRYRLIVEARDAAGNVTVAPPKGFRVVR